MAPQYSSLSIGAYMKKVEEARTELTSETPISFLRSWHRHPLLIFDIADNIHQVLQKFLAEVRRRVPVLFTAHSLPERVVAMKGPYPNEVKGTVEAVDERLGAQPTRFASKPGTIRRSLVGAGGGRSSG